MKLSDFKNHLNNISELNFIQTNGVAVPKHFHITEAGLTTKHFIDCGGTIRTEKNISLQLWVANDVEHKLEPQKLLGILSLSEKLFEKEDLEVEIEYQSETIGRYGLSFNGKDFVLTSKETNCLAKDHCGIPEEKLIADTKQNACTPGGGCC